LNLRSFIASVPWKTAVCAARHRIARQSGDSGNNVLPCCPLSFHFLLSATQAGRRLLCTPVWSESALPSGEFNPTINPAPTRWRADLSFYLGSQGITDYPSPPSSHLPLPWRANLRPSRNRIRNVPLAAAARTGSVDARPRRHDFSDPGRAFRPPRSSRAQRTCRTTSDDVLRSRSSARSVAVERSAGPTVLRGVERRRRLAFRIRRP
jgi:hypothetical protein